MSYRGHGVRRVVVYCDDGHREWHVGEADLAERERGEAPYVQFTGAGVSSGEWSRRRDRRQTSTDEGSYRRQTVHAWCRHCHGSPVGRSGRTRSRVGHEPVVWTNATLTAAVASILDAHPDRKVVRVSLAGLRAVVRRLD